MNKDTRMILPPQGFRSPRGSAGGGGIVPAPPPSRGHCDPESSDGLPASSPGSDAGEEDIADEWRIIAEMVGRLLRLLESKEERLRGSNKPPDNSCRCSCRHANTGTPESADSGNESPRTDEFEARLLRLESRLNVDSPLSEKLYSDQGTQTNNDLNQASNWSMVVSRRRKTSERKIGPFKGRGEIRVPAKGRGKGGDPAKGATRNRIKKTSGNRGTLSSPPVKAGGGPGDPQEAGGTFGRRTDKEENENPSRNRGTPTSPPGAGGEPGDPQRIGGGTKKMVAFGAAETPPKMVKEEVKKPVATLADIVREVKVLAAELGMDKEGESMTQKIEEKKENITLKTEETQALSTVIDVGEELPPPVYRKREANSGLRCDRCRTWGHFDSHCPVVGFTGSRCHRCWMPLRGHSVDRCSRRPFCGGCWVNREICNRREELRNLAKHKAGSKQCATCPPRTGGPTVYSPDPSSEESDGEPEKEDSPTRGVTTDGSARTRGRFMPLRANKEERGLVAPHPGKS